MGGGVPACYTCRVANEVFPPPLLLTRLLPPAPGRGYVVRQRVAGVLDAAFDFPLVLVTAPAGYGKSAALADFARQRPAQVAWLSLDAADNDPVRFWRYFVAALQRILPDFRLDTPVTLPELGTGFIRGGLDELSNRLLAVERPLGLILDDFHHIQQPDILAAVAWLVEHCPDNFHLVLSGRSQPALPLARWRARGRLGEVRARELAFNLQETTLYFEHNAPQLAVGGQIQQQIVTLTHGWAAGIRLLEIALHDAPQRLGAWAEGRRLAAEYLTAEVLDNLPPGWVEVLMHVAVLDVFTTELACLVGGAAAGQVLEQALAANLFVQRQDETCRLHPFFREALLQHLAPGERRRLQCEAAYWFEAHGRAEEALAYALAGENWQGAARLVLRLSEEKLQLGELHTLNRWLEMIPGEQLDHCPDLRVLRGWAWYLQGRVPEVRQLITALVEDESAINRRAWWDGLRCQMALVDEDNRRALDLAEDALAQCAGPDSFLRGMLLASRAVAQQALGDSAGALASYQQTLRLHTGEGYLFSRLFSLVNLGIELNETGQRLRALALCTQVLEENAATAKSNPMFGLVHLLLARLYWETNDLRAARQALETAGRQMEQIGILGFQISVDLIRCYLLVAEEEYGEALRLVASNRRRTRSAGLIGFRRQFDLLGAELALKMGRLPAVANWLDEAGLPDSPQQDAAREMEFLLQARYLLDSGALNEAEHLLAELSAFAQTARRVRLAIAVRLVQAVLAWKRSELGRVKVYLDEALALATPQHYTRLLLDYGAPLGGLLAHLDGLSGGGDVPERVEMLTRREVEVLKLLAENCTNAEIARALVLSSETVKIHLKHIFQKLNVDNRRQAVRRARQLEILPA